MEVRLLAGFADFAVFHGFDAADFLFGFGVGLFRDGGVGAAGVAGVLAAVGAFLHGAAGFLLHRGGGLLDV